MPANIMLGIRCDPELRDAFRSAAKSLGLSSSELLQQLLDLRRLVTLSEEASRAARAAAGAAAWEPTEWASEVVMREAARSLSDVVGHKSPLPKQSGEPRG